MKEARLALAAAGRGAWPGLDLDDDFFLRHLERHLAAAPDPEAALARVRADDFYLACACAAGSPGAVEQLERRFGGVIDAVAARFAPSKDRRAELRQMLRERLFAARPGAEPRIASYSGRGFLENWLRVAAVRAFVNAAESERREIQAEGDALAAVADGRDVELDFLKAHYRDAFRTAFSRAIARLEPAERLVLRLSVLDGLTCDEVAAALGVHRATAARRTAQARQRLSDATRKELSSALRVGDAELDSILRIVESNLDLSLSRLLGRDE
ncbi:sigma-70 family RNA polymerase sigma factor [Polyangium sp. y55x31]|uniref:sigma-70 family RNA polymerase sigma factor n=1 Tax=Polyangium sp. y55x31 TaxID=3042688 RepID=UPI00248265F3|nr:sigma-70 family RNA polymerase sigma factor [Polyangium sp. y55x31]MDI1484649.1 sigma-70 family RNA polymerase sigma factor [Polyangium sp. y55x31]